MPLNFVPCEAAGVASAEAEADGEASADGEDDAGTGVGLAVLHAVRTRIGMIAAATKRLRDTAWDPPLDIRRAASSILNRWRYAGQYAGRAHKVKIWHAVQHAGRSATKEEAG